jgi:hypothetical protein
VTYRIRTIAAPSAAVDYHFATEDAARAAFAAFLRAGVPVVLQLEVGGSWRTISTASP